MWMNLYKKGNLAKSIAGHDKEQIFVIVEEKGEYVYVADGRLWTIEKPKRKIFSQFITATNKCQKLGTMKILRGSLNCLAQKAQE